MNIKLVIKTFKLPILPESIANIALTTASIGFLSSSIYGLIRFIILRPQTISLLNL